MNVFEQKNAELVTEFDRYVREHPDFAERIPDNALVAMLVEGDEEFNRWSQEGAKRQAEKEQPIVYVKIRGFSLSALGSRKSSSAPEIIIVGQASSVVQSFGVSFRRFENSRNVEVPPGTRTNRPARTRFWRPSRTVFSSRIIFFQNCPLLDSNPLPSPPTLIP